MTKGKTASSRPKVRSSSRVTNCSEASSQKSRKASRKEFNSWPERMRIAVDLMNAPAWLAIAALLYLAPYTPQIVEALNNEFQMLRYDVSGHLRLAEQSKKSGFEAFERKETILGHHYYGQAAVAYKLLSNAGYKDANFELGKLTCLGFGTKKNPVLAKYYFDLSQMRPRQKERLYQVPAFQACLDLPT